MNSLMKRLEVFDGFGDSTAQLTWCRGRLTELDELNSNTIEGGLGGADVGMGGDGRLGE